MFRDFKAEFRLVRERNRGFLYKVLHSMVVAVEKWCDSHKQLIEKDAKSPPVYSMIMAVPNDHLW